MGIRSITTCNNVIEASMIKDLLENEGIQSFYTNEHFTTLMPHMNNIIGGGIQVMVEEEEYERALEIVGKSTDCSICCPICGSVDLVFTLGKSKAKKMIAIFLSLFVFVPFGNIKASYRCKQCGTTFAP